MTRLEYVNNILTIIDFQVNDNLEVISSTDSSMELMLRQYDTALPVPSMVKSSIRDTSYSDNLIDSDNNTILLKLDRIFLEGKQSNSLMKLSYEGDCYRILFQVINYITYDADGNEQLS